MQLSTHNSCILIVPGVITHCSPLVVETDLHPPCTVLSHGIIEPHAPRHAGTGDGSIADYAKVVVVGAQFGCVCTGQRAEYGVRALPKESTTCQYGICWIERDSVRVERLVGIKVLE